MPIDIDAISEPVALQPRTKPQPKQMDSSQPAPGVLVIGSINMDLVVRSDHMPQPGETVMGSEFATIPGGKGANQAVAAARIGGSCSMIGRVGDDVFGKRLIENLRLNHVETNHVRITQDCPSGVAVISVDGSGENAITVVSGANAQLSPDDVNALENAIAKAKTIVLQLEVPMPTVCRAAQLAKQHDVPIVLDPAPAPPEGLPNELMEVDIITPNQTEAQLITGEPVRNAADAKMVGAELVRMGATHAVIKMGGEGAMIVSLEGDMHHVPAFPVSVVDTTAAGDAFTAAMAVGYAQGLSMQKAVTMGCAAGALAASGFGAQTSIPNRSAVEQLLRSRS